MMGTTLEGAQVRAGKHVQKHHMVGRWMDRLSSLASSFMDEPHTNNMTCTMAHTHAPTHLSLPPTLSIFPHKPPPPPDLHCLAAISVRRGVRRRGRGCGCPSLAASIVQMLEELHEMKGEWSHEDGPWKLHVRAGIPALVPSAWVWAPRFDCSWCAPSPAGAGNLTRSGLREESRFLLSRLGAPSAPCVCCRHAPPPPMESRNVISRGPLMDADALDGGPRGPEGTATLRGPQKSRGQGNGHCFNCPWPRPPEEIGAPTTLPSQPAHPRPYLIAQRKVLRTTRYT